jgi:CRP/FNR family transcriptional regulator, cyclic AMP receptor protein
MSNRSSRPNRSNPSNGSDSSEALFAITQADAARLLVTESALGQLSFDDALRVVARMKPKRIQAEATLIREGEHAHNDFMMLILEGDVRVEGDSPGPKGHMVVTVMGTGSLIGEMGLLTGMARTASCVAASHLAVAVLSREALSRMIQEDPQLAAKFLLALSTRTAERLRETTQKLKRFMQLNATLQKEIYSLMDTRLPGAAEVADTQRLAQAERALLPTEPMDLPVGNPARTHL